jgi:predicted transcriptional regulator
MKTTKRTKVIGSQEYINSETGEIQTFEVVSLEDRDFNFDKIWIAHILSAIDEISNAKIKVLFYLFSLKRNPHDNIIAITIDEICKGSLVSKPTVIKSLKILEKHDIIKRKTGRIMINPDILFKGGNKHRMNVLLQYNKSKS